MKTIRIKRIYDEPAEDDGYRVLVDKIWPRGVSKVRANLDEWNKEVTPSTELRKWFDHKEERFEEFALRYREQLLEKKEQLNELRKTADHEPLSLLYAAKSPTVNHAIVLRDVLLNGL
ncbi:MAG: DUF488 domain-containing protein [Salinivirgaceae bacterium]|jgi:uncharacterized protein YeaO (DUF488 family)|nr:DUF488 domain-containing protein [Salinivirgaceae bacterium]MDY0279955.1 DUF488 domain-containing protein [Salinivirgaceae bacterium]